MKISYKIELSAAESVNLRGISGQDIQTMDMEFSCPEEYLQIAQAVHAMIPLIKSMVGKLKTPEAPILRVNGVVVPTRADKVKAEKAEEAEEAEKDAEKESDDFAKAVTTMEEEAAEVDFFDEMSATYSAEERELLRKGVAAWERTRNGHQVEA